MRVLVANPRGFCQGVDRAVEAVKAALKEYGPPVYLPHPVVHNATVMEQLKAQGAVEVKGVSDVPDGAVCVFSAHGSPPEDFALARQKRLRVVDTTCPLVTKVHNEAKRYSREGHQVVLIGHQGHQEVRGTTGQIPMTLLSEESEPPTLKGPVAILTQTTLSKYDVADAVARLRQRYPDAVVRDDICYAVSNRQDAVVEMVRQGARLVLILGDEESSNSQRMVDVAKSHGAEAQRLLDESEFDPKWLDGKECVGVSSGASTPDEVVQKLLKRLREEHGASIEEVQVADESGIRFRRVDFRSDVIAHLSPGPTG
ncbi:MAG: 4-hydroxy-3-methylbut-2-enyl diphosphate reductase [Dehalococcoidia bacterium]|nr:4-hydroxy-3-methylbut-2-enyl diphosphate reductase [Dehalococcoidia bacterium]